ncbi:MAG: hypothetical protein ABI216_17565 [Devosia sp.]
MNKPQSEPVDSFIVEFDLLADLPLQPAELKLVQELLPELVKEMLWLQNDEE